MFALNIACHDRTFHGLAFVNADFAGFPASPSKPQQPQLGRHFIISARHNSPVFGMNIALSSPNIENPSPFSRLFRSLASSGCATTERHRKIFHAVLLHATPCKPRRRRPGRHRPKCLPSSLEKAPESARRTSSTASKPALRKISDQGLSELFVLYFFLRFPLVFLSS